MEKTGSFCGSPSGVAGIVAVAVDIAVDATVAVTVGAAQSYRFGVVGAKYTKDASSRG